MPPADGATGARGAAGGDVRAAAGGDGAAGPEGAARALERHLETRPTPRQLGALAASARRPALAASAPPAGRAFVVLSANVFTAALRAVALAASASERVVVCPSRREPLFAALLVRAPGEGRPPFEVTFGEARAARPGEQVHAYGRDETMAALRAALAPGALFWPHGAGVGVAAAGAGAGASSAWRLAFDVIAFDQRGRLSPRVAFFEGDEAGAARFAGRAAEALARLAGRVPRGQVSVDERAAQRAYADAMAVAGEAFEGPGHVVGFDPAPRAFAWPPGSRAMHVARVGGADDAWRLLAPWAGAVVAVGGGAPWPTNAAEGSAARAARRSGSCNARRSTGRSTGARLRPSRSADKTKASPRPRGGARAERTALTAPNETPTPPPEAPRPGAGESYDDGPLRAHIHARGGAGRLDAVLDFVAFAARPMPLVSLLDEAPRRLAAIFAADVVSLYLLEGDGDTLVLRGNVGFEGRGLGQVRLKVGEGITGTAVEVMRPISVVAAPAHKGYRHFPELGEERFPVFAAVPILGRRGALGAVVLQRRGRAPFHDADVELLTALAAAVAAGVRAAELIDSMRDRHSAAERRAGGGTRKITLPARPAVAGRALGAVAGLKRPPSRPREPQGPGEAAMLKVAFDVVGKALRALIQQAHALGLGRDADFLETYALIVSDARLKAEALRRCEKGMGVAAALDDVARLATRSAAVEGSPFLEERARDIEDLCDALAMIAASDPRVALPSRAVLVANRLTVFDVLVSARSRPVGIALAERAEGPRMRVLLTLLGLPAVVDVDGLFRWVADGDIALVDADHGLLVVNPTKSEIAGVRKARRDKALEGLLGDEGSLRPVPDDDEPSG